MIDEWFVKDYNRLTFAYDCLAYHLSEIISFSQVKVPYCRKSSSDGIKELIEFIPDAESLKINKKRKNLFDFISDFKSLNKFTKRFPLLPKEGINGLLLKLLMSDIDGNWQNILIKDDKTWIIDFEYSGYFYNYEKRFIKKNLFLTWKILSGFLGDSPDIKILKRGIELVKLKLDSGEISFDVLNNIFLRTDLKKEEADYIAKNIVFNAQNIEQKIERCISAYPKNLNEAEENLFFGFETTKRSRCASSCVRLVLEHYAHKKPTFEELDIQFDRKGSQYVYLAQVADFFMKNNFNIHYFLKKEEAVKFVNEGPEIIFNQYSSNSSKIIERFTNYSAVKKSLKSILDSEKFFEYKPDLEELKNFYLKDGVVLCAIDNSEIYNQNDIFRGHHVMITGFDEKNVYYCDVGPDNAEPNKKVDIDKFFKALERAKCFDYGILAITPP